MKVKADRDESSPYAAMLAAQDVSQRCKVQTTYLIICFKGFCKEKDKLVFTSFRLCNLNFALFQLATSVENLLLCAKMLVTYIVIVLTCVLEFQPRAF